MNTHNNQPGEYDTFLSASLRGSGLRSGDRGMKTNADAKQRAVETPSEMGELGGFWRGIAEILANYSKQQLLLQKQNMLQPMGIGTWWARREDDGGSGGHSGDGGSWPMAAEKIPC